MLYREIGKTGLSVGVVGLGAEHLDNRPYAEVESTIHAAIDQGVNLMDVFMPGEEIRRNIGKALAGRRDKMLIQGHVGSVDLDRQYDLSRDLSTCRKYFDDLMRFLNTDYIDVGMLFFIDSMEHIDQVYNNGIVDYVKRLKEQGVVRAIGASSHNSAVAQKLVERGDIDLLMFSINPAFDLWPESKTEREEAGRPAKTGKALDREALYKLCQDKGVAITVMKALGGGKLLSAEHTPFAEPMSMGQCIHYALTRPAVVSALVGCRTPAQVLEAVKYLSLTDAEKDFEPIIDNPRNDFQGSCLYCGHCQPCPADIEIATVCRYLDIAALDEKNVAPSLRQHYGMLPNKASACTACGGCEERCPFNVPIIENMEKAAALFGA